jgi:hypothetical protein
MLFSYEKMELSAAEIWDSLLVATTGLSRAQFRKLGLVASRLSNCDHFYGNRFFQPSGLSPSSANQDLPAFWSSD